MKTKAYFFDVFCDGVYIWREGYQLLPKRLKQTAKRLLNLKKFSLSFAKTIEVRVTDMDTDELVMKLTK